jgi:hypothetical protein
MRVAARCNVIYIGKLHSTWLLGTSSKKETISQITGRHRNSKVTGIILIKMEDIFS